jgi:hypothetical protein
MDSFKSHFRERERERVLRMGQRRYFGNCWTTVLGEGVFMVGEI